MGKSYRNTKKKYFDREHKMLVQVDWIEPIQDDIQLTIAPHVQNVKPLKMSKKLNDEQLKQLENFLSSPWSDKTLKKFMEDLENEK